MTTRRYSLIKWTIWGAFSLAFFLSFFHNIVSVGISDYLMTDFAVGATAIGHLASIYFYVYLVIQIPTGVIADTIGARRTVMFGSLIAALGSMIFALAPNIELALIGRFLIGLGSAVAFVCILKIQAIWFRPREFAFMMGLLTLIGAIASAVATTPVAIAAETWGWRPIFVISSVLSLLSAWLCYVTYSNFPKGYTKLIQQDKLSVKQALPIVWGNRQTWLCSAIHFAFLGSYLSFTGLWGVPYLIHSYGLERIEAANWMIFFALCYTLGAFFYARLSDKWLVKRKPPLLISAFIFIASISLVLFWPTPKVPLVVSLASFAVLFFVSAANIICFSTVKESNPSSASGVAMATANGGILCAAILQPVIGYLLDMDWQGKTIAGMRVYEHSSYNLGFSSFLIVGVIALISAYFIKETGCKSIYTHTPRSTYS